MSDNTALQKKSGPPYARYAFFNAYNISAVGGVLAAAGITGHYWLALFAAAGEAIWMLFAPDSRLLRKLWFDKIWHGEQAEERKRRQIEKFASLPDPEKARALGLRELQERIERMAADNPTFSADLLRADIGKLGDLIDDFLDLALVASRYNEYLSSFDVNSLETDRRRYELQVEKLPLGDERREVAQKNIQVLTQRKERWKELRRDLQKVRGQMDLMENTFRLLADEVVTMNSPAQLTERLDEMRHGVEAVRQTAQETERFLQAAEGR